MFTKSLSTNSPSFIPSLQVSYFYDYKIVKLVRISIFVALNISYDPLPLVLEAPAMVTTVGLGFC